jgi:superfamily I DNA and/or RNA helicase
MKQLDMPVSIGTVDETQGGECSIVIVSLTRSPLGTEHSMHPLGFLASKNRANVMFSRAKHLVFFVGSLQLFTDCDVPFWRDLVSRAEVRDVNAWLSKTPK